MKTRTIGVGNATSVDGSRLGWLGWLGVGVSVGVVIGGVAEGSGAVELVSGVDVGVVVGDASAGDVVVAVDVGVGEAELVGVAVLVDGGADGADESGVRDGEGDGLRVGVGTNGQQLPPEVVDAVDDEVAVVVVVADEGGVVVAVGVVEAVLVAAVVEADGEEAITEVGDDVADGDGVDVLVGVAVGVHVGASVGHSPPGGSNRSSGWLRCASAAAGGSVSWV